jgi:hypothetical protein
MKDTFKNIDEYILLFPIEIQEKLLELRQFIHSLASDVKNILGIRCPLSDIKENLWFILQGIKSISVFILALKESAALRTISKKEIINFPKEPYSFQ